MSTTSATFIRQAFELSCPADPARGEIGAEVVEILVRDRQFDAATEFADTLLASEISAELAARVRLLLLPRLWATGRRGELADRSRESFGSPSLGARLAGYRALAQGAPADDATTDQVAAILGTMAAAEQADRDHDYARTHELFASARAAAQETTGYGLPEVGHLAVREVLALARRDDIEGALTGLDDRTRFPDSWQAPQLALVRAYLLFGAGRLNDAADAAANASALMGELRDATFEPDLRQLVALIAVLRGDTSGATTELEAGQRAGDELPLVRALLADAQGDPRAAAEVIALASAGGAGDAPGGLIWPEDLVVAAACSAADGMALSWLATIA
jgi:hypothetical protein